MRWRNFIRDLSGVMVLSIAGMLLLNVARAAEWVEPTGTPPSANPPGFVWTRAPSETAQVGGQFNVAGGGRVGELLEALGGVVFGGAAFDLGNAAGGQNVMFGSAKYSGMHADDALLLLQTASDATPAVLTDRLRVNRDGDVTGARSVAASGDVRGARLCIGATPGEGCRDAWPGGTITGVVAGMNLIGGGTSGSVTVGLNTAPTLNGLTIEKSGTPATGGNLIVAGCFGPVFRGRTDATFQGNVGGAPGYVSANARCNAQRAGSHVCTTAEVLNSINCSAIASIDLAETDMWIANLAPSLPTPTNDCVGWTTADTAWWGIKWRFNAETGGSAYAERCGTALPFACCS